MARSRWGTNFKKGMHVGWHSRAYYESVRGVAQGGRGVYLRLAPAGDISREYGGKQALIYMGPLTPDGKIPKGAIDSVDIYAVGLNDLYVVAAPLAEGRGAAAALAWTVIAPKLVWGGPAGWRIYRDERHPMLPFTLYYLRGVEGYYSSVKDAKAVAAALITSRGR